MTAHETRPGPLRLHALCISGLPPRVLANLIVTISARPFGATQHQPVALLSPLLAHPPPGVSAR